ncbi:MAG: FadR family transcriptional regulator [Desulfarculaceae bacterium]|nr:FadR family transcriptional regulator [Desulfarculaceae bacterium]MCF8045951.1 FadR family transcriptional regulator [Desulfarculaceae bacterium]MCF8063680.1 FadR family transcriptional regulator [Desulfarculaceae bacterium]MCF8097585.1 FadR family transcriptional regulator [Desulfarculaceae bacterium]MCF8121154.1 FadR family transcriptional regulator [Desulfarculaceae bacterium]
MLSDKYELKQPLRLPDQVAAILTEELKSGALKPGEMLPPEMELATKFGVSRAVIREALSQLKAEGLLESQQGRGVMVVGRAGRRFFRLEDPEKFNAQSLAHLYELRAILESEAAAMAAARGSTRDVAKLGECVVAMARAVEDDAIGAVPDLDFHRGIAEASGNQHLCDLMQFLNDKLLVLIQEAREHSRQNPGVPRQVQKEHEDIYRAIEARNPHKARKETLDHLRMAARRLGLEI